jgi:hypothetical protein
MSAHNEGTSAGNSSPVMSLELKLSEKARPLFEEAARYAHANNLWVSLSSSVNEAAAAELILSVKSPQDETPSSYKLIADSANQPVIHAMTFGREEATDRQETKPAALNDMVIDSQLEAFFSRAFGLHLDYLTDKRHPPGFW